MSVCLSAIAIDVVVYLERYTRRQESITYEVGLTYLVTQTVALIRPTLLLLLLLLLLVLKAAGSSRSSSSSTLMEGGEKGSFLPE